jgi:hypothetical protein
MTHTSLPVEAPARATSQQAQALADRLEAGARALAAFAATLTDAEWQTPVPHDGRTVGVVVHHVASVYPVEIELAQIIASGKPVTNAATVSLYADAPLTCQFFLEDHAVRHSYHHLARLKWTVGR